MEVAVAAAAAGRALRRAGGKGARALGTGAVRTAGRAGQCPLRVVARPTGPRAEVRLPRAPVAGVRSAEPRATGMRMMTRVARAWATWIQHGQRDFSRQGCQKTHPRLGVAVAAQV